MSQAKNHLSRFLEDVKRGETILIQDRNRTVAKIVPYRGSDMPDLVRDGIVSSPQEEPDVEAFLNDSGPRLPAGISSAQAVAAEREEGL